MARRRPLGRLAQEESERDSAFTDAAARQLERDVQRLARRDAQHGQLAARPPLAVDGQLPFAPVAVEAREEVPVANAEPSAAQRVDAHRLRKELQLVQRGMGGAVGPHDSVGAEVRVVPHLAEVAAVGPVLPAAAVDLADAVVDPLPDEAALQRRVAVERREVVGQAAVRVAHRMRVLAHDDRPRIVVAPGVRLDRVDLRVHRAHDVRGCAAAGPIAPDRPLVVERPRCIALSHPPGGGIVVRPVPALVAERPEDDARMVLVALDHVLDPLDERPGVARVVAQLVVEGVRLGVCLVHHVEAVPVAEVEPVRVVGVVRRACCVDVEPLHQPRVRLHRRARQRAAAGVVVVVPVDAADPDRLAVHEQLPVAHLDPPKAGADGDRLAACPQLERVESGLLGRPMLRRPDRTLEAAVVECGGEELSAARVEQRDLPVDSRLDREVPVPEVVVERRPDLEVAHGRRAEVDRARETSVPPLVLILDEARVRPADDDGVQLVRSVVVDELRDVELGRRLRVLREANRLAVHQHMEDTLERPEVEDDWAPLPPPRHVEAAPVDAGLVLLGHVRRQVGERHLHVRVLRLAEALHRPQPRYLDTAPATAGAQSLGRVLGSLGQAKLPLAVERREARRRRAIERRVRR